MEIEPLLTKFYSRKEQLENRIQNLVEDLRLKRKVANSLFDQIYPVEIQKYSSIHWTPVQVAIRATEFLVTNEKSRVLDVGSGCGKFCIVGALSSPGQFFGVEQRPHLVEVAHRAAKRIGANRASFIQGNMADLDWFCYDSFYLYNPFYENEMKFNRIDDTVQFSRENYNYYVGVVQTKLQNLLQGTKVVTYHDFGGEMPPSYHLVKKELIGTGFLKLWIKLDCHKPILRVLNEKS
jgi:SAM-dependent methyltransferase